MSTTEVSLSHFAPHGAPRCDLCPLQGQKMLPKSAYPPPNPKRVRLVLVSEPPEETNIVSGGPLSGPQSFTFRHTLAAQGIDRNEEVTIIPATLCKRPRDDKQAAAAARCCAPRVLAETAKIRCLVGDVPLATLGKEALATVTGYSNLTFARGFIWNAPPIDGADQRAARRAASQDPVHVARRKKPRSDADNARAALHADMIDWSFAIQGMPVFPLLGPQWVGRADAYLATEANDLRRIGRLLRSRSDLSPSAAFDETAPYQAGGLDLLAGLGPEVSLDIETDGVKPLECKILCVGLSDGDKSVVIWPWRDEMCQELAEFLRSRCAVVCHNGYNFDQICLNARGMPLEGIAWEDTLLAHHAVISVVPQRLDWVVSMYLDARPWKIAHGRRGAAGGEKGQAVKDLSAADLIEYNAGDCILQIRAWRAMQADLSPERRVYEHDKRLAAVCRDMQILGVAVDHERREALSRELASEGARLLASMRELTGIADFTPAKPALVSRTFLAFGAPPVSHTASGAVSVDKLALASYTQSPIPRVKALAGLITQWRVCAKIRSTYVGGCDGARLKYDENIDSRTLRAHYNWKPFGTVSGRLACRLQSCPRHSAAHVAGRAREIYVPAPGHEFVYFDVSQAEMRLGAFLSADPRFMAACNGDVHANNAKNVFPDIAKRGWLDGEAKKDPARGKPFRDIAKNLGFAICYGAGADKIHDTLTRAGFPITIGAVRTILRNLRDAYCVYYKWAEENVERVRRDGYMRTPFLGRIRHFGKFPNPPEVFNFPVQSGLADIVNERTLVLQTKLAPLGANLVMQVHDADIFETPICAVSEVKAIISAEWAKPIPTPGGALILPIDLKTGMRWSEL